MMADRNKVARRLGITLWLATAGHVTVCFAGVSAGDDVAGQAAGYRYSDDWKIVSAPPPPGPYETVNVDPRVPGQDITRPVPRDVMVVDPAESMPTELGQVAPPAAGRSADPQQPRSRQTFTPPPPAGAYGWQDRRSAPSAGYGRRGYTNHPRRYSYPGYGQGYRQDHGRGYNPGYGYSYPGQYAPDVPQDIPPPPYTLTPDR
jgi:hypothetical protein